jgi:hypothetical protein
MAHITDARATAVSRPTSTRRTFKRSALLFSFKMDSGSCVTTRKSAKLQSTVKFIEKVSLITCHTLSSAAAPNVDNVDVSTAKTRVPTTKPTTIATAAITADMIAWNTSTIGMMKIAAMTPTMLFPPIPPPRLFLDVESLSIESSTR